MGLMAALDPKQTATPLRRACQVNFAKSKAPSPAARSGNGGRPNGISFGAEAAKCWSADQMALDVEGVVDRCVGGEKSLG